ncbi:MAG: glycosyltransferase family 2 protein [Burkholderiales bacterium]|nr:glycosyltransferase family 2 protein [Phycisphaerae bacterium]
MVQSTSTMLVSPVRLQSGLSPETSSDISPRRSSSDHDGLTNGRLPVLDAASHAVPRVSVIIVNWNRLDDILFGLRYLRKSGYPDLEIIIVDNGSNKRTVARLSEIKGIRLLCLPRNEGPSHARNVGMAAATGKYLLLLDSDAVLAKRCLADVVTEMEADPSVAIAGFRVMNWHTRKIDQWLYAQSYATHGDRQFQTYSFSAAGALIRADALREVGGFWEQLFIYNEEVELSIRLIRAGYRILYTPQGRVFHRPCGDGRASKASYFKNQIRNWIWIFFRHYPRPQAWWKTGVYSALYLVKGLANRHPLACLRGILEGIGGRDVAAEFADKMTPEAARLIQSLNRRRRVALWNLATTESPRRKRVARSTERAEQRVMNGQDAMDEDLVAAMGQ